MSIEEDANRKSDNRPKESGRIWEKIVSVYPYIIISFAGFTMVIFSAYNNEYTRKNEYIEDLQQVYDEALVRQAQLREELRQYKISSMKLEDRIDIITKLSKNDSLSVDHNDNKVLFYQKQFIRIDRDLLAIKNRIDTTSITLDELLGSLNPTAVDRFLTIPRLTDKIAEVDNKLQSLENRLEKDQEMFRDSIRSEINASDRSSTTLIGLLLLVLPLLVKFILDFITENRMNKYQQIAGDRSEEKDS